MPKISADEIVTQGHIRFYYQPFGPGPTNPIYYAGLDGQYITIEDQTVPKTGGRTRLNVHDPRTAKQYKTVGNSTDAPDFPTATVQFLQKHGAVPKHLIGYDCPLNFYQVVGNCRDLSDIQDGATDYWKIFNNGVHESSTHKGGAFDADEWLMDGLDFTFDDIYPFGAFSFGEEGATEIDLEIVDGVYGSRLSCGACGPEDDGTKLWYGIQINDAGVAPMEVKYTVDGFATMTSATVTGAVDSDEPKAIDIVGRYLVVVYNGVGDNGYFFAEINELTGVPGAFTKVTTGFVAAADPNDIWVQSPREVWFAADGGYIYKSENIINGVFPVHEGDITTNDLYRIQALDEVLVAVGATGAVVMSFNRGNSFSAPTVAPGANDLLALSVYNDYTFWVGDNAGNIQYTEVRGEIAWTTLITPLTLTEINDIVFVNEAIGYISAQTAGPVAVAFATFDGGQEWSHSQAAPFGRFVNWAVFDVGNRISYPIVNNQGIAANHVVFCGLHGDGTDGIVLYGAVSFLP